MPGKLLNLTFHQPGFLTGEDLRFKAGAIQSQLVSGDAMDEIGQNNDGPKPYLDAHPKLSLDPKKPALGGLQSAKFANISLLSMNGINEKTWGSESYTFKPDPQHANEHFPSEFEEWLLKVLSFPAEVVVFAGHHSGSLIWGSETTGHTRIFTAFVPRITNGKPFLVFRGFRPNKPDAEDLAGPFDVTQAFSNCRLLIVLGCNGATKQISDWRECIKKATGGRAPFILGWRGVHKMPRDANGQFFSPDFWTELAALAPGAIGSKNLDFLHVAGFRDRILELWAKVMQKNFTPVKKDDQSHLFFDASRERGAGAIDPDGNIFWVVDNTLTMKPQGQLS